MLRIDLFRYIRQYRRNAPDNAVVFTSRTGLAMDRNTLNQILYRLKDWANVNKPGGAHMFRHTFATMYLEQGGDVYKLSRLMGHTSVSTTEIYVRGLKNKQARKGKSVLDGLK